MYGSDTCGLATVSLLVNVFVLSAFHDRISLMDRDSVHILCSKSIYSLWIEPDRLSYTLDSFRRLFFNLLVINGFNKNYL